LHDLPAFSQSSRAVAHEGSDIQQQGSALARRHASDPGEHMGLIILIILVLLLIGAVPTWGHSRQWGYGPSGLLGLILIVVLILLLLGYIPRGF
jgi:hypothetical protein